ncbi:RIB43A-like with coiled-coils protein 1 [Coelomomyces lativittatus]|nr:RIB43A-like with coiled-coils protein 1 [Coelomomyces lativittatus]KAJ1505194.1 RIB43A-like with coiled-coils protein 1 [Coelomomyces lativittatus]KAJ1506443.1 RIB43A-like with coiled-coils protein 1 [Coelomomyces lativittatus]
MYKLDHLPTQIEQQAILRRRRLDEERKLRIFDPKVRTLGIDVQGLDEQIKIKKGLQNLEKQHNDACDQFSRQTNEVLQLLDAKMELERRNHEKEIQDFRQSHQNAYQRRDFDLYDPNMLKKEAPARTGDEDPRTTVSGLQKFEGEDLKKDERLKLQKEQSRLWTWKRKFESEQALQKAKNEAIRHDQAQFRASQAVQFLQDQASQQKKEKLVADNNFNLQLAMEKRLREIEDRQQEEMKNMNEIQNMIHGKFLTERDTSSNSNSNKLRVDAFKGNSPEAIREIYENREKQIKEAQERHNKEKEEQEMWIRSQMSLSRTTMILEREKERQRRLMNQRIREQNKELADQFKSRKKFIDEVVYTNPPTQEFFNQFNTTSR